MTSILVLFIALYTDDASLRLEGIGTDLIGFVDDRITEITSYPQRNCLQDDWLVGFEFRGEYYLKSYFTTPGPISFGVVFPMYLYGGFGYDLTFPISFKAGGLTWGCALDLPRWYKINTYLNSNDTNPHAQNTFQVNSRIGTMWRNTNLMLDVNLGSHLYEFTIYKNIAGNITYISKTPHLIESPSIRLTINNGQIIYRTIFEYSYDFSKDTFYDNFWIVYEKQSVNIATGVIMKIKDNSFGIASINLQGKAWNYNTYDLGNNKWRWEVNLPLGAEWTEGIIEARVGIKFQFLMYPKIDIPAPDLFAGLTINPIHYLTFDIVPKLENITSLTEWHFGVAAKFYI